MSHTYYQHAIDPYWDTTYLLSTNLSTDCERQNDLHIILLTFDILLIFFTLHLFSEKPQFLSHLRLHLMLP
jgi:hypothetical protein